MSFLRMDQQMLEGKRVLIREDLNVPINDGVISNDTRIRAALPSIEMARAAGAEVIIMSHLGRPVEAKPIEEQNEFSMQPVADRLAKLLDCDVEVNRDYLSTAPASRGAGSVTLLENVRINAGEKANDDSLAKSYAALCDVFVMDAFGTAHRAQASTHGVAKYALIACAGPLLASELDALERSLKNPERPMLAIVGGAKVSSKLEVLKKLSTEVDQLIVGGGIANTFLAAGGINVGKSLFEPSLIDTAKALMQTTSIPMPTDVVVAKEFSANAVAVTKLVIDIEDDDMILDIGPATAMYFAEIVSTMKTIIWNGPVGVFEFEQFSNGTQAVAKAVADSAGFSIAGGGETIAAIDKYAITDKVSYISTGGGAFLEYVQGTVLPAVEILERRASDG
ncbi:MAG: phosphoglycerate kinase [SAR86 cluster bacterium]|uniref:Phosphoglycerate kinase n=1 Tax=SAR86 cluster bacterium TaxID=2030880 RepID=A0A2A4X220_9GAMM|nr:MAG: phosphoglycerate kinase [SAR86 cluster bacterium]